MYFDRHQKVAIGLFLFTSVYLFVRDDFEQALGQSIGLFALLLLIIFYRIIAHFASYGFPQASARDAASENPAGPYAFLFWILYLGFWAGVFFR